MSIHVLAAVSSNNVIGNKGKIPWVLPGDLKRFRRKTIGHTVVMGRKTFESLGSVPLPDRHNIVVSKTLLASKYTNVEFTDNLGLLIARAYTSETKYMIIGGHDIYKAFLPYADTLSITKVHLNVEGDITFPDHDMFHVTSTTTHSHNDIIYDFNEYLPNI